MPALVEVFMEGILDGVAALPGRQQARQCCLGSALRKVGGDVLPRALDAQGRAKGGEQLPDGGFGAASFRRFASSASKKTASRR